MTEWGVVGVIITIVGFVISIVTVCIKVSSVIQKNTDTNEELKGTIVELKDSINDLTHTNKKDHDHFFREINDLHTDVAILKEKHRND